jgi:hypothetical protein
MVWDREEEEDDLIRRYSNGNDGMHDSPLTCGTNFFFWLNGCRATLCPGEEATGGRGNALSCRTTLTGILFAVKIREKNREFNIFIRRVL